MKTLLIEDDEDLAETIREELRHSGVVEIASTGQEGSFRARTDLYDAIIIDIVLPDINGIVVCRDIRAKKPHTSILMLTARTAIEDKVAAFEAGADDYLTKPFHFTELRARVRALHRRGEQPRTTEVLSVGDLSLDTTRRMVTRRGRRIPLRRREFDLLEYLMRNTGQVVTRTMILEHVWESDVDLLSNTVDVHIKYLRDKIGRSSRSQLIRTVPGVGYKIEA